MDTELPVVGVALMVNDLERHHNWLIEGRRDLELQDFCHPDVLENGWEDLVGEARRWLDGYDGRLGIHGPFYDLPLNARDIAVREIVQKRLTQALRAAEALKGTHLVIHSPISTWDSHHVDAKSGGRDEIIELCQKTLGPLVERAESAGVTFVIENIEDRDPHLWAALARSFESSAVACSLDTGHAHYAHGSTGGPPVDHFIQVAGKDLAHIHLQDADGYADRHWRPGQGTIHWHALFAALRDTGATPRLLIELADHRRHEVREAADWLIAEGLVR